MTQILWINGAFGSGKTTTAQKLLELLPGARLFDPEIVGFMLRHYITEPIKDFQDWPAWRGLVPEVAAQMLRHYGGVLVVPMTILREDYLTEILAGLTLQGIEYQHILLDVSEAELIRRIESDTVETGARQWRLEHVETYVQNREWLRANSHVVESRRLNAEQVASVIAGHLAALTS
ncbi:ATP-binding protein [Arthrobacter sp. MYb227]|uniref:AAA family ATPase n=1 Tax=Arthrobacter sp. MYb227 TaxID=1848601 RepID=UPI000CFBB0B1|nr:AAA family ATPase [Arthrobacter sp. MYb227]PQZ91621.1 ATP-binding protein [Arthrobacter sp. MYb227]